MDVKSDVSEDDHHVFFLQFLGYDREVYTAMDRFTKSSEGENHMQSKKMGPITHKGHISRVTKETNECSVTLSSVAQGTDATLAEAYGGERETTCHDRRWYRL